MIGWQGTGVARLGFDNYRLDVDINKSIWPQLAYVRFHFYGHHSDYKGQCRLFKIFSHVIS